MFPLGSVLVPHMLLPLHVFEPRYRILFEELVGELPRPDDQASLGSEPRFGVTMIERGSEVGGGEVRAAVGTLATVVGAQLAEDGRWAVVAVGGERIRVLNWLDDDPYPRAEVAASSLTLVDDPTDPDSLGAEEYDGEGLACRRNVLISDGMLSSFLLNCTTANRLGVSSNACAVRGSRSLPGAGAIALAMAPGVGTAEQLRASVGDGLLVNSFTGLHSGVNPISGDFSVGADGLMIRNGQVAEPAREITLASTIQRLLSGVIAVGGQLERLPSGSSMPWIVIDDVSLGGR